MAEVMTVAEVLEEISAKRGDNGKLKLNRFNKKNFEKLMKAMLNDVDFTAKVAKVKGDTFEIEEVAVSKEFRKFVKKLVEKAGVDKTESERIMTSEFTIDNVSGLYEFFASALYTFIESGNRWDFMPTADFKGSIAIKEVGKSSKTAAAKNPQTKEFLGNYETTKEAHKELAVKSGCPSYLKSRIKVD